MLRPKQITDALGISSATLRNWSNEFAPVLSPAAQKATTQQGTAAQRRYSQTDLAYLRQAQALLNSGKTYAEALAVLQETAPDTPPEGTGSVETHESEATAPLPPASAITNLDEHPLMLAFREALAAKDETIKAKEEEIERLAQHADYLQTIHSDLVQESNQHIRDVQALQRELAWERQSFWRKLDQRLRGKH